MRKWMLTWILPTLLYRLHFHWVLLVGNVSLACNDMTPDQLLAASVNCSASPERHTRSYDYMEGGDIRIRKLFCRTQFYLRIDRKGKVKGTANSNCNYCILEIRTVAIGVLAIRGVESDYFLAMNKAGKLYGKKICNEDCNFIEHIEENNYNTYASAKWTHHGQSMFIALNPKGKMIQGRKTKKENKSSHFLPMPIS